MSEMRRNQLIAGMATSFAVQTRSTPLTQFVYSSVERRAYDGEWSHFAYSYDRAFECLWDKCYEETKLHRESNLTFPLLFICRQSVELWLKTALAASTVEVPPLGHNLRRLWDALIRQLEIEALPTNDPFTTSVTTLLNTLDAHDDRGDRFRYPESKDAIPYPLSSANLDDLFRAHYLITTYCEAVYSMAQERENCLSDAVK